MIKRLIYFISIACVLFVQAIAVDLEHEDVRVIKSIVDASTIRTLIVDQYALEDPVQCSLLNIGVNDIYLVNAGAEKYVVRLSRVQKTFEMTPSEFLFELEWLEFLHKKQIPVSYPLRRLDGKLCGEIEAPEGPRYVTLFSFAEGSEDLSADQAFILGQSLAALHLASDTFETDLNRIHLDVKELLREPIDRVKAFLGEPFTDECQKMDTLGMVLADQINALKVEQGGYGIITGDFHGYNQHFTSENQLTLFDFEFCAYGYRIYDLATFKWCRGSEDPILWQRFLAGYTSLRCLSEAEVEAIDLFVQARHIWWMGSLVTMPELHDHLDAEFWQSAFMRLQSQPTDEATGTEN
jgi:Ser/Thr protein kinase RdoA (MazF antagonist)